MNILRSTKRFIIYRSVNLVFPFLTIYIFSLYIDHSSLGIFFLCQAVSLWCSLIVDFGFLRSGIKIIKDKGEGVVVNILALQLILSVPCLLLTTIAYLLYSEITFYDFIYIFIYGVSLGLLPRWFFQANDKMYILTRIELLVRSLSLLFLFLVPYFPNRYFVELIYFVSTLLISFFSWNIVLKGNISKIKLNTIITLYKSSKLTFLSRLSGNIGMNTNVIIMSFYLSPELIAIYGIGERIAKVFAMFVTSISEAAFPNYKISTQEKLITTAKYTLILSLFFVTLSFVFLPKVLLASFGVDTSFHYIVLIMILSCVFYGLSSCVSLVGLVAEGKFKYEMYSQIFFGIASLFIVFALVSRFDLLGASLAYLINSISSFIIIFSIYKKVKTSDLSCQNS